MDGWIANGFIYNHNNHISYGDVISWLQYDIYVDVFFSNSFTHTMNINIINTWFFCCTSFFGVDPSAKEELEDTTQLRLGTQNLRRRLSGCSVCAVPMARWPCHRLGRRKRKETERVSQGPVKIRQDQDHDYGTCAVLFSVCGIIVAELGGCKWIWILNIFSIVHIK